MLIAGLSGLYQYVMSFSVINLFRVAFLSLFIQSLLLFILH